MAENNTSNALKVVLGIVLALFLFTAIYSVSLYRKKKENDSILKEQKQLVIDDLNALSNQYDLLSQENALAQTEVTAAKDRIKGLLDSLHVAENNVRNLWKYKSKYADLQKQMNVILAENDRLRSQNTTLSSSLSETQTALNSQTQETAALAAQNLELANTVEKAAVLNAYNVTATGIIERRSGKIVPNDKARRIDEIQVCFIVGKNDLVGAGNKEFYIQVIDPNNNVLGLDKQVTFGENTLNYSLISKFHYDKKSVDICEFVKSQSTEKHPYKSGKYFVNIFDRDRKVATTSLNLR